MSTEQTQPEPQQWGAPPPPTPPTSRWTVRRIVIAVAVAVGIAAAGGVAIYAANGSVAADQGPANRQGGGPMLIGGPMGGAVDHGEFQNGKVTELTDDEITAESEDGYTRTYIIDDDTQLGDGIEKGDEVMIIASVEGTTATAESVIEPSAMQRGGSQKGDQQDGGPQFDSK